MSDRGDAIKVAVCEYLLSVNRQYETPFIAPTAINWLGDGITSAVLSVTCDAPSRSGDLVQALQQCSLALHDAHFDAKEATQRAEKAERELAEARALLDEMHQQRHGDDAPAPEYCDVCAFFRRHQEPPDNRKDET